MFYRILRIRRVSVLSDLITAFQDESLMDEAVIVSVTMVNEFGKEEYGIDSGGVLRDCLSAFWTEFYESCTVGVDEKVPCLRHDFQQEEWLAVGRILVKGFLQLGFVPYKLSRCVIAVTIFGEKAVTKKMLLDSLKLYLSPDEREVINAALNEEIKRGDQQFDEWIELLDRFSCKRIPGTLKAEVEDMLLEVAHKELIQVSQYVIDSCGKPFTALALHPKLKSITELEKLFDAVKPTTRKVLNLFASHHANSNAERDAVSYLHRYIRGLNEDRLEQLLRFCTGASTICVEKVNIVFTKLEGVARRPVAHTCSPTLELPCTYESYPQFREEFNSILSSGFWGIDFL